MFFSTFFVQNLTFSVFLTNKRSYSLLEIQEVVGSNPASDNTDIKKPPFLVALYPTSCSCFVSIAYGNTNSASVKLTVNLALCTIACSLANGYYT